MNRMNKKLGLQLLNNEEELREYFNAYYKRYNHWFDRRDAVERLYEKMNAYTNDKAKEELLLKVYCEVWTDLQDTYDTMEL